MPVQDAAGLRIVTFRRKLNTKPLPAHDLKRRPVSTLRGSIANMASNQRFAPPASPEQASAWLSIG